MIEMVIIAAVPSQLITSQEINQHSPDSVVYQLAASDIADLQWLTTIELDVQKIKTAAKETWTAITNRYLSTQLGPKS